jgi:cytoskeletal protein CcmA (bactofilin family)
MFDKKPKISTEQFGKTNRIVEGTLIKGDIISQADFRLDGELQGNFKSKGKLVVGPAASVIGNISCENADIEGKFEGKLEINDLLNVKATATIKGEVIVGRLSMEAGALFTATCNMKNSALSQTPVLKDAK